jgi:hypothetical protein
MNDRLIDFEKLKYIAIRDKLIANDSEIDEQTLADTLEGETDLTEMLAATVRALIMDETIAEALQLRIAEMAERLARFEQRAARRRELVRDAMADCDIKDIKQEDFTAALRNSPPKVVVIDESKIPQPFWEQRPHLLKRELLDTLKGGTRVEGAMLSNPGMTLSVRTR